MSEYYVCYQPELYLIKQIRISKHLAIISEVAGIKIVITWWIITAISNFWEINELIIKIHGKNWKIDWYLMTWLTLNMK